MRIFYVPCTEKKPWTLQNRYKSLCLLACRNFHLGKGDRWLFFTVRKHVEKDLETCLFMVGSSIISRNSPGLVLKQSIVYSHSIDSLSIAVFSLVSAAEGSRRNDDQTEGRGRIFYMRWFRDASNNR